MNKYPHLDDAVDRLADTSSYHDARRLLGLPQPKAEDFTAAAIEQRLKAAAARSDAEAANQQLYNLTGPVELSPEQILTNQVGIAACRAAVPKPHPQS